VCGWLWVWAHTHTHTHTHTCLFACVDALAAQHIKTQAQERVRLLLLPLLFAPRHRAPWLAAPPPLQLAPAPCAVPSWVLTRLLRHEVCVCMCVLMYVCVCVNCVCVCVVVWCAKGTLIAPLWVLTGLPFHKTYFVCSCVCMCVCMCVCV
jgi:hypothetical protein